uniref:BPTI/Kunitz inhibitor domain-containing protein n=1 Tax=Electrophorus electricus TaxID=8005 RepID=A0AAY5EI77_ELEEL
MTSGASRTALIRKGQCRIRCIRPNHSMSLAFPEVCVKPVDPGPCRQYVVKWHYDPKANSCAQFWYGGCHGNQNQFDTEKSCRKSCVIG